MRSRISSLVRCVGVLPDGGTDFLSSFKSIVPFPHCFGPHWESALAQILVFQFHAFRGRLSELRADDLARGICPYQFEQALAFVELQGSIAV